jgi:CysZ protein
MLKEIVIAFQSYAEAHRFIIKHRLWKWIVIPGIFYAALFIISMYFFIGSVDDAVNWFSSQLRIESWLQQKRSEWLSFLFVMMNIMLRFVLFFFYFSLFKYLILITGSPVFAYLSQKTELIFENKKLPFNFKQFKDDTKRGIQVAVRNALWQSVYLIPLIILSMFPVAGWVTPIFVIVIECYYFGFSMLDYSCRRQKYSLPESNQFISSHKGLSIGNGVIFYAMHVLIVLAPAYAVIAATLSLYKSKES